jgi:hypothetical protein
MRIPAGAAKGAAAEAPLQTIPMHGANEWETTSL